MSSQSGELAVPPLHLLASLPFFVAPGLLLFISVHFLMPVLHVSGIPLAYSYLLAFAIPLTLLLVAAIVAYLLSSNPRTWASFCARYRLLPLSKRDGVWILGALAVEGIAAFSFSHLDSWLVESGILPYPEIAVMSDNALAEVAGGGFAIFFATIGVLVINVLAEELWFRGYLLPRQIAAYGATAWIFNWLPWWFFAHAFKWWGLLTILPTTAVTVYLAHKTGKTSATIVMHFLGNAFSMVPLILIVTGVLTID